MCGRRLAIYSVRGDAVGEDILGLHIDTHLVGLEVHTLVCNIATLVAVYHLIGGIEYYRVGSRTLDYVVEHRGAC